MQNSEIVWNEYDPRKFEQCLLQIRNLTREREPLSFAPQLQKICALAGVAVVFVPELEGTRAGGATRWLSPTRAIIQMSLRYKTNDTLWFYFFHEAAHTLKHSKERLFIECDGQERDEQEREADEFAQNIIIPLREYSALFRLGTPTKAGVEGFASRIGVDPGMIVGRLQSEKVIPWKVIPYNWFNDLKQRYEWLIEASTK